MSLLFLFFFECLCILLFGLLWSISQYSVSSRFESQLHELQEEKEKMVASDSDRESNLKREVNSLKNEVASFKMQREVLKASVARLEMTRSSVSSYKARLEKRRRKKLQFFQIEIQKMKEKLEKENIPPPFFTNVEENLPIRNKLNLLKEMFERLLDVVNSQSLV